MAPLRNRKRKAAEVQCDVLLVPVGATNGPKRTPIHIGDPYAKRGAYRVKTVLGMEQRNGVRHYKVEWLDLPLEYTTWEPSDSLHPANPDSDAIEAQRLIKAYEDSVKAEAEV